DTEKDEEKAIVESDPYKERQTWSINNARVLSYLIGSMEPIIVRTLLSFAPTSLPLRFGAISVTTTLTTTHKMVQAELAKVLPQALNSAFASLGMSGTVQTPNIRLPSILHVPNLVPNLVSAGQLSEAGCKVIFRLFGCVIQDRSNGRILGTGRRHGRNYFLEHVEGDGTGSKSRPISGGRQLVSESSVGVPNSYASFSSIKLSPKQ
ncbi:hypothetical protein LINGRAPRIM_LOCUS2106, partial [Linum grandiflorum]